MRQRFAYRARPLNILVTLGIGFPCMTLGAYGIITGRILERGDEALSPALSLTVFAMLLVLGLALSAWALRMVLAGEREVVITPTHLQVPASPTSSRIERIPLAQITRIVADSDAAPGEFLALTIAGGRTIRLAHGAFDSPAAYDDCHAEIVAACDHLDRKDPDPRPD